MKNTLINKSLKIVATVCMLTALLSSCKKNNAEADDPNIVYTSFDKTIIIVPEKTKIDSVDLNLDTNPDFWLNVVENSPGDTISSYIIGYNAGIYIDSTKKIGAFYELKSLDLNQTADKYISGVRKWLSTGYLTKKRGTELHGLAGAGDKYYPTIMINQATLKYHYGWIRINISSDFQTYKIIDGAYNLIDDTPIKMGAK